MTRESSGPVAPAATPGPGDAGPLVLALLDWLAREPRTHRETVETWGSHCPRITPWEDAQEAGLVRVTRGAGAGGRLAVVLTGRGRTALQGRTGGSQPRPA